MKSMRGQLLLILITGLLAIVGLTGGSVYLRVIHQLDVVFDYQLTEVAYAATFSDPGLLPLELLPLPKTEANYEREAKLGVQI